MSRVETAGQRKRLTFKDEKGFTLVELLVVIGILVVLGAITFPAVQNALAKSREAAGLQNMRQLADGLLAYVSDVKAYPPSATRVGSGATTEVRVRWFNILAPYLGAKDARAQSNAQGGTSTENRLGDANQEVFNSVMIDPLVRGEWKIGRNNSIGYNHQYLGSSRPTGICRDPALNAGAVASYAACGGTFTVPAGGLKNNGMVAFPIQANEIQAPDRTIAFAYSDGTGYVEPYRPPDTMAAEETTEGTGPVPFVAAGITPPAAWGGTSTPATNRLTTWGNEGYQIDPTFLRVIDINPGNNAVLAPNPALNPAPTDKEVVGGSGGDNRQSQAARGIVTNRYEGGTIVAFADGHVEYLKREAVYLDPRTGRPSNRLWNGLGRDNDENGDGVFAPATESPVDSNEWIATGSDAAGAITTATNAIVDARVGTGGAATEEDENSSFLQGAPTMLVGGDSIIRGGQSITVDTFLLDRNGPTTPKRRPFPITVTVLGQTLVNK